ncbi:hypothetical protein MNODULE_16840 [Nitrospiraceae bacterium HYJII51-Mn-bac16s-1-B09]|uniref:Uncharacterized protein n=1 Tax=Candidatus Manganitrophus noduliformans TaxID=2606439 RepID=A0A7X6DSA3_9BACT|nr:delta-60 repeat domain-containing protein [Candidatus Manganitrophus noduliformans]NKE72420.1 hypothetical protein [Candidatus Manganitrophus noduliformans]
MRSLKFIFLKFPFTLIFTGLFLALFLAGCGQTGDRQTTIGPGAADNFSSPIPTQLQKLRTGLNAKVIVDGGTPRVQIVNLQVDTQNDRVIGTIPNLPVGQHTFEIQYFIDNALIATAPAITVNIQANVDTPVPFNAGALVYPDTDGDGFTNLNEVEIFGSASDAWTRPDLKPEVSVVVNPGAAILPPNGVQTFTAAIAQNANQGVNWSLEEPTGGGSITPGGTYTAPAVPGIYNVVATSQADPAKSATIPVLVVTPGSLDTTSFGSGVTAGTVAIPIGNTSIGQAVAIQPDGKIVVAGYSNTGGPNHFTLARYNIDGTLDTASFGTTGTGGTVVTPIGTGSIGQAVVIQPDGKIVVAGYSSTLVCQTISLWHDTTSMAHSIKILSAAASPLALSSHPSGTPVSVVLWFSNPTAKFSSLDTPTPADQTISLWHDTISMALSIQPLLEPTEKVALSSHPSEPVASARQSPFKLTVRL